MSEPTVPQLVDPEWLQARLSEPDLHVLDCTVHLSFDPETGERSSESGRADWEDGHVPGSVFADLIDELSVTDDPDYPYEVPAADRFAAAMARLGVGDESRVVLYDAASNQWAARLWWLLRTFGFDTAGVLDGGWDRWARERRPVSTDTPDPPSASLTTTRREQMIATKSDVRESIDRDEHCLVNCLRPEDYDGTTAVRYGRPGQIPSSVTVPSRGASGIVDRETNTYLPRAELRQRFAETGALEADRVITYCGGGIAASSVAFALTLLGVENVAVYDGSLSEWGADPTMPMETE